jgi:hypothetical protein
VGHKPFSATIGTGKRELIQPIGNKEYQLVIVQIDFWSEHGHKDSDESEIRRVNWRVERVSRKNN